MTAPVQDAVLAELAECDPAPTTSEVAELVYRHLRDPFYAVRSVETTRVAQALSALVVKGYVERLPSPSRPTLWRITPAGRRHHNTTEDPQ